MEGVAAQEATEREPCAPCNAVLDQREARVLRARGREAARAWQQGRKPLLVEHNESGRHARRPGHGSARGPGTAASALRISPSNVPNGVESAAGRPITTSAARAGAAERVAR